ncbi:hypothetical protein [Limimaricola litoreus]|uniref:Uncharacterized protein n=1 Tax=Limimaricola litoreus TaxID=2955316 RepID=A0A9X2JPB0_9RHOB|nr:hypothetical protein [Limimaricola litoreus]MCP1169378.1 hypothetical protein [Limimaricola litoreus]
MVRAIIDRMTRDDLVEEVNQLRAEVDRLQGNKAPVSFGQRSTGILEKRRTDTERFRERLRAARPDLQIFRARPWWQRTLIRAIWRTQALFGFEGWVPRRERAAVSSLSPEKTQDPISSDRLRRFLDELSLVSARHGLWVENTPRGARLVSAEKGMGGYFATPWPSHEGQFEFDAYRSGSPPKGGEVVFGVTRIQNARVDNDHGQPERVRIHPAAEHDLETSTRAARETELEFELIFSFGDDGADTDTVLEALVAAECDDAIVGLGKAGLLGLGFTRSGTDAETVISSTARKVTEVLPGCVRLREVRPNLVTLEEVAVRLGMPIAVLEEGPLPPPSLGGLYQLTELAMALHKRDGKLGPALAEATPWLAAAPGAQRINARLLLATNIYG